MSESAPESAPLTQEEIALAKFFSNLNPDQVETFKNLLNSLPKNVAGGATPVASKDSGGVKESPVFTVRGVALVSAPKVAILERLYHWRKERAINAGAEVKRYEAQIENYRTSLEDINNSTETISTKLESDRHTLIQHIQDANLALSKARALFEYHHNKVVFWEHKGNHLSERLTTKIEKVMLPSHAEFEVVDTKKQHVTEKLLGLKQAGDMGKQRLADLQTQLTQHPEALDHALIRNTLAAVEGLLQSITKEYDEATGKVKSIAARVQKSNIGIAEIAHNLQLEKTAPHENVPPSEKVHIEQVEKAPEEVKIIIVEKPQEKPREVKEEAKPTVEYTPVEVKKEEVKPTTPPKQPERLEDGSVSIPIVDISETKDHVSRPPSAPHDTVLKVEHLKSEPRVKMAEHATINGVNYLATWNKQYGHELKLSEQEIGAFRPNGVIWDHLSIDEVEKMATAALAKKAGRNRTFYAEGSIQTIYSDDEIAKRLLALRDAYVRDFPPKMNDTDTKLAKSVNS